MTVLDDETDRPVPCRVHFRSPAGVPYQPHGHHDHVNSDLGTWHIDVGGDLRLGRLTYAYIPGTCQGWLPRGDVIVDVARGFEYEPLREVVHIQPGQRELTLRLKRWPSMNADGWYSADSHVHLDTGPSKGLRAFIHGGACRENVIDEQDRPPLQAVCLLCGKGSSHVLDSVCSM